MLSSFSLRLFHFVWAIIVERLETIRMDWKALPDEERSRFIKEARELKGTPILFQGELQAALDERPKRPQSAFFCFSRSERARLKESGTKLSVTEITAHLKQKWESMTLEDQLPFEEEAQVLQDQYIAADSAWLRKYHDKLGDIAAYEKELRKAEKEKKEELKKAKEEKIKKEEAKKKKKQRKREKEEGKKSSKKNEGETPKKKKAKTTASKSDKASKKNASTAVAPKKKDETPPPARKSDKIDYSVLEALLNGSEEPSSGAQKKHKSSSSSK